MDKKILEDFFNGSLPEAERKQVAQWIEEQGDEWTAAFMADRWEHPEYELLPAHRESMKARVFAAVGAQQPSGSRMLVYMMRAAAVLVLVLAGVWWFKQQQPDAIHWYTVANEGKGHIMLRDTLPDGTMVTLNEHSYIRYSSAYNKKERTVQLTGEAFFEVRHDQQKPFIVKAGHASTKVYGTAFSVAAYPSSGQLRVALQRGSVGVTYDTANAEKMLAPGEMLIYNKTSKTIAIENQPPDKLGAWTTGKLVFFKTPLNDVLYQLEQRYDVHFSYDKALSGRTVTATFDGAQLSKVLQHISFVWDIHFETGKDSIYVR